eukprot:3808578-Pleurochrysis_carterae.AAC.3
MEQNGSSGRAAVQSHQQGWRNEHLSNDHGGRYTCFMHSRYTTLGCSDEVLLRPALWQPAKSAPAGEYCFILVVLAMCSYTSCTI